MVAEHQRWARYILDALIEPTIARDVPVLPISLLDISAVIRATQYPKNPVSSSEATRLSSWRVSGCRALGRGVERHATARAETPPRGHPQRRRRPGTPRAAGARRLAGNGSAPVGAGHAGHARLPGASAGIVHPCCDSVPAPSQAATADGPSVASSPSAFGWGAGGWRGGPSCGTPGLHSEPVCAPGRGVSRDDPR